MLDILVFCVLSLLGVCLSLPLSDVTTADEKDVTFLELDVAFGCDLLECLEGDGVGCKG